MDKTILGKRIKEARIARSFTQERLAEEAEITTIYISEIERGIKMPSLSLFVRLAKILQVSADSLLRDDLDASKTCVYNEITEKLENLTPKQRIACSELIDVYIKNL